MPPYVQHRKVLVLRDEPAIRNLLTLVKRLEREHALNGNGNSELAAIKRRQFEAAILDLRCSNPRPERELHSIDQIRPSLVGKTLVLVTEVNGPKTLELLKRYLTTGLPQTLLWLVSHRYQPPK